MTDAEVMTTAIIAAQYFGGNHQRTCCVLKTLGYIPNMLGHSRYISDAAMNLRNSKSD
jgi:hypothetical protein